MAFYQSSASNPDDALTQIATFLQSHGYTAIRTRTENTNGTDVLTYTLQCPDLTYMTLLSTDGIERPYHPATRNYADYYKSPIIGTSGTAIRRPAYDAFDGRYIQKYSGEDLSSYATPWLGCIRHLTYDSGQNWYDQPDAKRVYETDTDTYYSSAANKNSYSAMPIGYTTPNLYVFVNTNPDCVHIVSEYEDNKYGHLTIGNLAKSHDYVGGQYIVGTCQTVDGRNDFTGYIPYSIPNLDGYSGLEQYAGGVYCEGNGDPYYVADDWEAIKGWGRVIFTTGVHVCLFNYDDGIDWSASSLDHQEVGSGVWMGNTLGLPLAEGLATAWGGVYGEHLDGGNSPLGSTFDLQTGQAAPIPLSAWCEHEVTGAVYLGSWVHVGVVQMSAFRGKEEFTLGGDTYQVFPMSTIPANPSDGTPKFRDFDALPYEVFRNPEGNNYMLGLAIKKTV